MKEKIKIKKTKEGTIYHIGNNKFRIVQNRENEFFVQKLFKETETKGYLWWKKTSSWEEWKKVDEDGKKYYRIAGYNIHISNYDKFKTYKTLDKAIKWIEDYNKYPIYH